MISLPSPLGRPHDADGREGESKEVGTPIAHEDARRIEVVAQESEATAGQCSGQKSRRHLMERKADGHQSDSGDTSHPSGKAIEAIQPVDRVGDSHKPNNSGQKAEAVRQSNRTS